MTVVVDHGGNRFGAGVAFIRVGLQEVESS